jgi:hypothetical protein
MICVASEVLSARSVNRPTAVDLVEIAVAPSLSACSVVSLRPLYSTMKAPFLIGAVAKRPRPVRERPMRKALFRAMSDTYDDSRPRDHIGAGARLVSQARTGWGRAWTEGERPARTEGMSFDAYEYNFWHRHLGACTQRRRRMAGMRCAIPVRCAAAWCSGGMVGKDSSFTIYASTLDDPSSFHPTAAAGLGRPSRRGSRSMTRCRLSRGRRRLS